MSTFYRLSSNLRLRKRPLLGSLLIPALLLVSCHNNPPNPAKTSETRTSRNNPTTPRETPEAGSLPNSRLTPGATLEVTKEDICTPGYTKKVRDVPVAVKRHVYAEYNTAYVRGAYEVDHLIPLELGGSNSVRNLWPEAYDLVWGAHVKDQLENRLHEMVCQGSVPMETAQQWIAQDWISAYQRVFHTDQPLAKRKYRENSHPRRRHGHQP